MSYLPCRCNANEEACLAANSSSCSVSCCVNRQSGCYGAARASAPTMTKLYRHYLPCFLQTAQLKKLCFLVKYYLESPAVMPVTVVADIMGIMWTSRTVLSWYIRDKKKKIICELSCTRMDYFFVVCLFDFYFACMVCFCLTPWDIF